MELRWLKKEIPTKVPLGDGFGAQMVDGVKYVRTLQSRVKRPSGHWSAWEDIPEVEE